MMNPGSQTVSPSPSSNRMSLAGVHVLVVEDHDDSRHLIRMVLRQAGAQVDVASNSTEGFDHFKNGHPDVIVSDIGMPEETGYDLIRKIRALPRALGGETPAIALTAWTRKEEVTAAFRAGFQVHIPKPLDATALVQAVAELSKKRPS